MKELSFRGKDRYRPSWSGFLRVAIALVLIGVVGYSRIGATGLLWLLGLSAAALVLGIGTALRSWTTVGPAGITTCWGIGSRGRTYPWQDIRWIDVRQTSSALTTSRAARITVANGRIHTLPALRHTTQYPQPTFDADFAQVVEWWHQSTDPTTRVQLPKTVGSRLVPQLLLVILILLIAVGVVFIMGVPN